MIPLGFALEVFAGVNRGIVLAVGDVAVEKGLGGAFIHETARDNDDALPIGDRHGAGLDNGLAGEIASWRVLASRCRSMRCGRARTRKTTGGSSRRLR